MLPKKKKNITVSYILPLILVIGFYAFFRVSILPYIYTKQAQHQLLIVNNQTTEIYWKEPDLLADKKYPAIIFLHGIQKDKQGAKAFVRSGLLNEYSKKNFFSVAASMSGYGESSGKSDFCGKASQNNLVQAINFARSQPHVDPNKVAVVGISCGASIANVVANSGKINALILVSGFYNFKGMYAQWSSNNRTLPSNVMNEINESIATEKNIETVSAARSSLPISSQYPPTLILVSAKDPIVDPKQSIHLHQLLDSKGIPNTLELIQDAKHPVPTNVWKTKIDNFFENALSLKIK
ncbi:TPA: prolyl oligopeptidase family serine peptidase [Acinetobacter baumannii]|uniref:alpha/beta hydrolase family protein n=1 Tax=Acinetobacter baumannii TaxID=470 RepID=UPI00112CCA4A|nr:alpha/beta fold hydrolase [Acinetobacter baumannii]MDA5007132.1 prolyl oligopeptidase family serine peptidase [Acinetobacter baumannii]MDI7728935.1 prolyl oligopeptidase family serine peptidase [Acinetobacter baumannii]MDO7392745.1 prolyl oligopeptidase family serine peptidase [Acinetobacter baumannii]MDO7407421.1 prolyl oligopeptidase family serine peptidase [Acinetobacter baumannii]MDV5702392.1 prolyl oligopeptidase family serine peptidase [Acinetobacter baumannii]